MSLATHMNASYHTKVMSLILKRHDTYLNHAGGHGPSGGKRSR